MKETQKLSKRGFTMIELMIAASVLGLTAMMAAPRYVQVMDASKKNLCIGDRHTLERAESNFYLEKGRYSNSLSELYSSGYIKKLPECHSSGNWSWDNNKHEFIRCSVHSDDGLGVSNDTTGMSALDGSWSRHDRWFKTSDSLWTAWGNQTVHYKAEFVGDGDYEIGLSAKNHNIHKGWTLPTGYDYFHVRLYVDGVRVPAQTVFIRASDSAYQEGTALVKGILKGKHTISFQWANDRYKPSQHQDANIEINQVLIKKVK